MAADVAEVIAVGVNCTSPVDARDAVPLAGAPTAQPSSTPTPASRGTPTTRAWEGPSAFPADDVAAWVTAGARLVGGCCRVGPEDISALRDVLGAGTRTSMVRQPSGSAMDVTTFYALFSATCFTLLGLWWTVVQRHEEWLRDPEHRAVVGGVYLSFLLPALMGLFAQVGGTETPAIWRVSFVGIAVIGGVSTLRLLRRSHGRAGIQGPLMRHRWVALVVYALVAVIGAVPEIASPLQISPIQAEAILLILLVLIAHGLVWEFMVSSGRRGRAGLAHDVSTTSRWVALVIAT